MAKLDSKDPRCIVADRADGRNVHDWHWSEKDITPQAKARLTKLLTACSLIDDGDASVFVDEVKNIDGDATSLNRKGRVGVFWDFNVVVDWRAERKNPAAASMASVQKMMGDMGGGGGGGMPGLKEGMEAEMLKSMGGGGDAAKPIATVKGTMALLGFDQDNVDDLTFEIKVNPGTERTEHAELLHRRFVTEGKAKLREKLRDWAQHIKLDFDPRKGEQFRLLKPGMKVDVTRDGGVRKECVTPGEGDEFPTPGSKVKVHYVGTLDSNGEMFDSSRERGEPFVFDLKRGKVIKGWDEGVATMRKGERAVLTIRSDYGYGDQGAPGMRPEDPPKIPGKATLKFDVEVLGWEIERTDVSKRSDGSVMKHTIEEGPVSWQRPEYEGKCVVDFSLVSGQPMKGTFAPPGLEGATVCLGDEDVPPGIEACLESMVPAEVCEVALSHRQLGSFAASDEDRGPYSFKLKLLDFDNPAPLNMLKGDACYQAAEQRKLAGTELYKKKLLDRAKRKWKKAIEIIEAGEKDMKGAERKKLDALKLPSLTNLAAVQLMHKEFRDCISSCDKALELDPHNVKAALRRAKAFEGCGDTAEARRDLEWILGDLEPGNADAKAEMAKLEKREGQTKRKEKDTFGGMFDKMAAKKEEAAKRQKEEAKAKKAEEAAAKYRQRVAQLQEEKRLPRTLHVVAPQDASVDGAYQLDESGPGWKGEPVWQDGDRRVYYSGLWWMVTEASSKVQEGLGKLQSANANGRMPHEVDVWLRSVPGVGWEQDAALRVSAAE